MSLVRPVLMPDGIVRNTHTISSLKHIINSETIIEIESFDSNAVSYITVLSRPVALDMTLDDAYDIVSADPIFEEYSDPTQAALDEVLDILTDEQAETVTDIYPSWAAGVAYTVGDRRKYDGKLYRCVQAHTSQEGWEPPVTPAMWTRTGADPAAIEEWVQPTGAQDAYKMGDKVTHNDSTWVSDVDDNVWEPGVYGWTEVSS